MSSATTQYNSLPPYLPAVLITKLRTICSLVWVLTACGTAFGDVSEHDGSVFEVVQVDAEVTGRKECAA